MKVKHPAQLKTMLISGPVGELEVRLNTAASKGLASRGLVVLSHPHPLYGGTMNNKVITTIERALQPLGYDCLAFNFRGVGRSHGTHDHAVGEMKDLLAVVDWGLSMTQAEVVHLAGFSFGSYISLLAAARLQPKSLLTVAPPVGIYDFSRIDWFNSLNSASSPSTWNLIQGGQDEVVDPQAVLNWAMKGPVKPDVFWREAASHFFHGELIWLKRVINLIYG